jgi:predicted phage terminase large subunit-like protein
MSQLSARDKKAIEGYIQKLKLIGDHSHVNHEEPESSKNQRKKKAAADYNFFVTHYFPHYAQSPCADFHIEEANKVLRDPMYCGVQEWARGLAKSTHFDIFVPLWLHLFHSQMRCMLLVGKNLESAKRLLSDLQAECEANPQLKHDFGQLVQTGDWSEGNFTTATGAAFYALGKGQSPRGLRNGPYRPEYIVLDDADDDEECRNPQRVDAAVNWVLRALIPAMSNGPARFVMVNNRIGSYTILTNLVSNKNFKHRQVNALDKDGNPVWPQQYSKEFYDHRLRLIGWPQFNTEYLNNPTYEGKFFKDDYIQWAPPFRLNQFERIVAYWDVAYSESQSADYNAVVVVGLRGSQKHVIDCYLRQSTMEGAIRWMSEYFTRLPKTVLVEWFAESQFWNTAVDMAIQTVAKEQGFRMPLVFLDRPGRGSNKFARIMMMLPAFQRKEIYFSAYMKHNTDMQRLIEQIKSMEPGSRSHDDGPDALEGAISKLENTRQTNDSVPVLGGNHRPRRIY